MAMLAVSLFFIVFSLVTASNSSINATSNLIAQESIIYATTSSSNVLYQIYIEYQYKTTGAHPHPQPQLSVSSMSDYFAQSTTDTFKHFQIDISNSKYCVIFSEYYNNTASCSHYHYNGDIDHHISYGTFLMDPSYSNNMYAIIPSTKFKEYLGKSITNSMSVGSFTIISVDILMSGPSTDNEENIYMNEVIEFLNIIDMIVYGQLLAYIGIAICIIIIAKLYAIFTQHDDVRYLYFIYHIIFSLNFFGNSIVFILRIFEQKYFILGACAVLFLFIFRLIFDISTTVNSKQIWIRSAFISKRVKAWLNENEGMFVSLSIISGPIGAITFANSRLFTKELMFMGIPKSMITHFIGDLFWKIWLIQRLPELVIQFVFIGINGFDIYFLFAFITTVLCILCMVLHKLQLNVVELNNKFLIQQTSFLMEISSQEINKNSSKFLLKPNALKQCIAKILNDGQDNVINTNQIEFPSFEAIKVSTENNYKGQKVYRCYGLKAHISINTISISRRVILMKLQKAQDDGSFIEQLSIAWNLKDKPSIDDIVMVYDVNGDHVIQRSVEEPRLSIEGQRNLEILTIQKQEKALQAQKEKEKEKEMMESNRNRKRVAHHRKLSTNPFDQFPDMNELGVKHERIMSTNPFDEYYIDSDCINDINNIPSDSDDTLYNGHRSTITESDIEIVNLNSYNKSTANKVSRRRQLDQSFVSLDMAFDIDHGHRPSTSLGMGGSFVSLDMAFDDDNKNALRLTRITSASSMQRMTSL